MMRPWVCPACAAINVDWSGYRVWRCATCGQWWEREKKREESEGEHGDCNSD